MENLKCTIILTIYTYRVANVISSNSKALNDSTTNLSLAAYEVKVDHIISIASFLLKISLYLVNTYMLLIFCNAIFWGQLKSLARRNIYVPRKVACLPVLSACLSLLIWWVAGVVYSMHQIPMKHTWCSYLINGWVVDWTNFHSVFPIISIGTERHGETITITWPSYIQEVFRDLRQFSGSTLALIIFENFLRVSF